ncbi:MAG TPA: hypothetical protein DHV42_01420 [Lachnospiraceae bacterium]|nr:hypothetical protein [Lachnospiraceae bacterium]
MTVAYIVSVTLALFAGALPAQILGLVWEMVCSQMELEIPYIALLRLLGAVGAIAAVILSDKIRGYILVRDLMVGAVALEALSLIGFSLSRVFWNLGLWVTALGFSMGMCFSLICYLLRETYSRKTSLLFSCSPLGAMAGTFLVSWFLSHGRSWRAACQGLAIFQILLCMVIFLLRRILLRDFAVILRKRRKEAGILRQRRREQLIREKGEPDERAQDAYLVKLLFLYGAALCCGLLLLSAVHLTFSAQVASGDLSANLADSILMVCAGMALGRILVHFTAKSSRRAWAAGTILAAACLAFGCGAAWAGKTWTALPHVIRFGTGLGAGMIFPNLIQTEDERFDDEAQTAMAGLLPAFYLGGEALITPFVQSMRGAREMAICASAMLVLVCCMGACLAFSSVRIRKR